MAERYTEQDGRGLAVQMLREIAQAGGDACSIESRFRDGAPQFGAFARYLAILRERQSADLDAGYAAILTDFLGSYLDGSGTGLYDTPGFYDSLIEAQ